MKTLSQTESVLRDVSSEAQSTLVSKNITIFDRRTSVRLEPAMWDALMDISMRERCSLHDICSLVYVRKEQGTSLTAAIRAFLMLYYRSAATELGHIQAGHGDFNAMKKRARITEEQEILFARYGRKRRFSKYSGLNDN